MIFLLFLARIISSCLLLLFFLQPRGFILFFFSPAHFPRAVQYNRIVLVVRGSLSSVEEEGGVVVGRGSCGFNSYQSLFIVLCLCLCIYHVCVCMFFFRFFFLSSLLRGKNAPRQWRQEPLYPQQQ